jgi:hypothetical protein
VLGEQQAQSLLEKEPFEPAEIEVEINPSVIDS